MSEEERLKLENELLMTKSKAQMINLYLDKLEETERLNNIIKEVREYIEDNTYKAYETEYMDLTGIKELLEILDKVEEKK